MNWQHALSYTDIITAIIDLCIPAFIVWQVYRLGVRLSSPGSRRSLSLPIAVLSFFALRALQELHDAPSIMLGGDVFEVVIDILSIISLVVILLNVRKVVEAGLRALNEAGFREAEYRRAKRDYSQIVRHRMNNPLTIIKGAAITLQAGAVTDESTRDKLCEVIITTVGEMGEITLEPERRDALEYELDAMPDLPPRDS